MKRISRIRLAQIEMELSQRDKQILESLRMFSFMKTDQVKRLYFALDDTVVTKTPRAIALATIRNLNRLKDKGLIEHLPQSRGGILAGAKAKIWYLTEAGHRLLDLGKDEDRKKVILPSSLFLRHTLAIVECYVQVVTICRKTPNMELSVIAVEPECWRSYDMNGKKMSLRPDLFAITMNGEYKDLWFIEMDLATEGRGDIIRKCERYLDYYRTKLEQRRHHGIFPAVLFIVPSDNRKTTLKEAIAEIGSEETVEGGLSSSYPYDRKYHNRPKFFLVIVPEELEETLKNGVEPDKLI